ncbi:unnamed protein product, partial [Onchocerca ochengi]|uniref:Metalloendopeptidase n=1 Tax=Onchocerca ochengi TaxID=42157 RepID=A0A182EQ64_ONCOC
KLYARSLHETFLRDNVYDRFSRQLYHKITSNEIDDVICAEVPNADIDKDLYEIVTKNMIHGPCGTLNPKSPYMIDGKCSKRYPRALISNTITGNDGFLIEEDQQKMALWRTHSFLMHEQNPWKESVDSSEVRSKDSICRSAVRAANGNELLRTVGHLYPLEISGREQGQEDRSPRDCR